MERPGNSKRLVGYLLRVVCGLGLFVGHGGMVLGLQPEDGLPARVVDGERFESLQFAAEEIPAPVEAETDTETILAPDQPGNIDLGAGQSIDGRSDEADTVLDPNQVGNLMTRLDALEHAGEELPLIRLSGFFQLDDGLYGQNARARAYFGDMQDGVGFRRARLQAIGKLTEFTAFTIEMDFAQPGRPSFVDVWGEQSNIPFFGTIRIGQFRQPGTMDSWTSVRHLNFLERSAEKDSPVNGTSAAVFRLTDCP